MGDHHAPDRDRLGFILLLLLGLAPAAFGQGWGSCATYEDYLHWAGAPGPFSYGRDVVVNGHYAYVASEYNGLAVIDVTDSTFPLLANLRPTGGSPQGLAVNESHVFVANYANLAIMSLENPVSPNLVSTLELSESANVVLTGSLAIVARRGYGVSVVDVTDPVAPAILGTVDTQSYAYALVVDGVHVYVADLYDGLQVIVSSHVPGSGNEVVR